MATYSITNQSGINSGNSINFSQSLTIGGSNIVINGQRIHIFTTVGSSTFTVSLNSTITNAQILIVAGGGGSGGGQGGGGGGGGVVYYPSQTLQSGSYTVTVGGGGAGGADINTAGTNGGNSSITGLTVAIGGGGGGGDAANLNGNNGGSGGGSGAESSTVGTVGTGTAGQGNNGGLGTASGPNYGGGGGGGAGASGSAGTGTSGGNGGNGLAYSISGTSTYYGGGGGGGSYQGGTRGTGGLGGGGNGASAINTSGSNGSSNTGGGGGAAGDRVNGLFANGGSGIVIISYTYSNVVLNNIPLSIVGYSLSYLFSQLSTAAQKSATGVFSLRAINSFTAKVVNVRRSTDNATQDIYSDRLGNLLTVPITIQMTGQTLAAWLNGATGYVTTWYDQSGKGSHMSCSSTALQPKIDLVNKWIDFKTTAYFDVSATPSTGPVPYKNTENYTVLWRHNTIGNNNGGLCGCYDAVLTNSQNNTNNFRANLGGGAGQQYQNYWYNNDVNRGTYAIGNKVTWKWDGTNRSMYINGSLSGTPQASSGWLQTSSSGQLIGKTTADVVMNGEMYSIFMFNTALSDADRALVEGAS